MRCNACGQGTPSSVAGTYEKCMAELKARSNLTEPSKDHGQGVFSSIEMPTTQDHLAVGRAIGDLLKDGWIWGGLDVYPNGQTKIVLRREWRA